MTITHKINDFLFELFPGSGGELDKVIDCTEEFITEELIKTEIKGGVIIHITFNIDRNYADKEKIKNLVNLLKMWNTTKPTS